MTQPATPAPAPAPGPARTWPRAAALAPVAVALLLYAPSLAGGYTMDDDAVIAGHPAVRGDAPLVEVFTREYWGRPLDAGWSSSYRPLVSLSLAIEERVAPGPTLHRVVNWLLYAALVWLVAQLCAALAGGSQRARDPRLPAAAVLAALAFAVLPAHADNAASIVGRADAMAAALAIVALLAALRGGAVIAAGTYLAALLCKESVALLPAVAGWLWFVRRRADAAPAPPLRDDRPLRAVLALALAGLGYLALRQRLLPVGLPADFVAADNVFVALTGPERQWANLSLVGHYAEIVLWPVRLCSDHTYADILPPDGLWGRDAWRAWLGVFATLCVLVDAWRALSGRGAGLLVAAAVAALLLGQFVVDLSVIAADRLVIWPTTLLAAALCAALHGAVGAAPSRDRGPWLSRALAVIGGVALCCYAALAVDHGLDWTDRVRLHQASVARCPAAVHNRLNLALELQRRARGPAAEADDLAAAAWHFGVAAAGHARYPAPLDFPAFAAEARLPLAARLARLPELVGAADPVAFWRGLEGMLRRERRDDVAAVVAAAAAAANDATPGAAAGPR